ncbi:MAG: phage tail tube protein [Pseudomonadota bacterium]
MQLLNKFTVKKDGQIIRTVEGGTLTLAGEERTPVVHDDGTVGFTSVYKECSLEAETTLAKGERLSDLNFHDVTISAVGDTGQTFILRNAFTLSPPSAKGGKVPLKISAETCEEM